MNGQRFRRVGGNTEVVVDAGTSLQAAISLLKSATVDCAKICIPARVVPLDMPPLLQRREDIPLAKHFTALVAKRLGIMPFKLSDEVLTAMQGYSWPGNVRQIHNVIETMLILAPTDRNEPIDLDLLPAEIHNGARLATSLKWIR